MTDRQTDQSNPSVPYDTFACIAGLIIVTNASFSRKKLLKIAGFWVGRIFKGLPKVAVSLIYRQHHLRVCQGRTNI